MNDFPDFMTTPENAVAAKSRTKGIGGWVYDGIDGKQMAYRRCGINGKSNEHSHDFEEYFVVIQGEYTLIIKLRFGGKRAERG